MGKKEDERKIEQNCFLEVPKKMLKNKELGLKITGTDFFKGKNVFQAIKSDEKKHVIVVFLYEKKKLKIKLVKMVGHKCMWEF